MRTIEKGPNKEYNKEGINIVENGRDKFFKFSISISKELLNSREDNDFKCMK